MSTTAAVVVDLTNDNDDDDDDDDGEFVSGRNKWCYSPSSSAYLQHLAEICHVICRDARFRPLLFTRERGDDIAALLHLSDCYNTCCEKDARAMLLYARMFHRKGPWFTLDDLFFRYYSPPPNRHASETPPESTNDREDKTITLSDDHNNLRCDLFLPVDKRRASSTQLQENSKAHDDGSEANNQQQVATLKQMLAHFFTDISQLYSLGLVRAFSSPEECGKVSSSILTGNERKTILHKLGCGSKNTLNIWTQVSSQRSISSFFYSPNKNKTTSLELPVQSLVNDVLRQKFINRLRLLIPLLPVKGIHSVLTREHDYRMCLRLCEEPLQILRRAVRLYLCASAGPGNMRWDGRNGWSLLVNEPSFDETQQQKQQQCIEDITLPESPALLSKWHKVIYPGLHYRMGLLHCSFTEQYTPLPVIEENKVVIGKAHAKIFTASDKNYSNTDVKDSPVTVDSNGTWECSIKVLLEAGASTVVTKSSQLFRNHGDFFLWEQAAELRAAVDYFIEWNEVTLYANRRLHKRLKTSHVSTSTNEFGDDNEKPPAHWSGGSKSHNDAMSLSQAKRHSANGCDFVLNSPQVHDYLELLSKEGRKDLIYKLLTKIHQSILSRDGLCISASCTDLVGQIHEEVEATIQSLHHRHFDSSLEPLLPCAEKPSDGKNHTQRLQQRNKMEEEDCFQTDAERISCSLSIICQRILLMWFQTCPRAMVMPLMERPWLRHLSWESVLAYVIWDCVAIIEKRGYHNLAVIMLKTILKGNNIESKNCEGDLKNSVEHNKGATNSEKKELNHDVLPCFVQCLLSRRVRGKAHERLVIDKSHVLKKARKNKNKDTELILWSKASKRRVGKKPKPQIYESFAVVEQRFCAETIQLVATNGSVPFSFIRGLARRMKSPLANTLNDVWNEEMMELRIRLAAAADNDGVALQAATATGYCEWTPAIDYSIANSILHETETGAGRRCAFIGMEEDSPNDLRTKSINVEELAMEEYAAGRLPAQQVPGLGGGGWVGWHDEGGHVRALFRILCSSVLLGQNMSDDTLWLSEQKTVFISPYQAAPFDLHVGHSMYVSHFERNFVRSFYGRRRRLIEDFLRELELMNAQDICDLVYESVVKVGQKSTIDSFLERDKKEVRTLSMLASGFGGKMLSSMFRSLCFDYRQYCGGMPDLLLVRAIYDDDKTVQVLDEAVTVGPLVNLGQWIGESFDSEYIQKNTVSDLAKMLIDRDDEFLGCSKHSDGSGSSHKQQRRRQSKKEAKENGDDAERSETIPEKLVLLHNSRPVTVQCMFVEVKSSNDRLDGRQEDWLNILDQAGHARVCKFRSSYQSRSCSSKFEDLSASQT